MGSIPVSYDQRHARFYADDGAINAATAIAAEDADIDSDDLALDTNVRLRIVVSETGAGTLGLAGDSCQLQYRLNGGSWTVVDGSSSVVRSSASPNVTDGANLTRLLTQFSSNAFVDGTYDEVNGRCGSDGVSPAWNNATDVECEWCVQFRGADLSPGDVVELRGCRYNLGINSTFEAYTKTPSYTVVASDPVYEQETFRGRNDNGTEATATWKAAADTDFSQDADRTFRLRFGLACTDAGEAGFTPSVYYRHKPVGGAYGDWAVVSAGVVGNLSKTTLVARVASLNLTHGADATQQVTTGDFTSDNNGIVTNGSLATLTTVVDEKWELEVCLFINRLATSPGDTFEFKVTNDGTDLDTYTETPEVTVLAAHPPFSDHPSGMHGNKVLLLLN